MADAGKTWHTNTVVVRKSPVAAATRRVAFCTRSLCSTLSRGERAALIEVVGKTYIG
jgi:hypothetical protein